MLTAPNRLNVYDTSTEDERTEFLGEFDTLAEAHAAAEGLARYEIVRAGAVIERVARCTTCDEIKPEDGPCRFHRAPFDE